MPTRRRARYVGTPFDHGQPIARPNFVPTTIFFVCIAAMFLGLQRPPRHALLVDIPVHGPLGEPPEEWPPNLPVHRLVLTSVNEFLWDGEPVSQAMLTDHLRAAKAQSPRPGIVFTPQPNASYEVSAKVLLVLTKAGVTEERFCLGGLADYREFGKDWGGYRLAYTLIVPAPLPEPLPVPEPLAVPDPVSDCDPA